MCTIHTDQITSKLREYKIRASEDNRIVGMGVFCFHVCCLCLQTSCLNYFNAEHDDCYIVVYGYYTACHVIIYPRNRQHN